MAHPSNLVYDSISQQRIIQSRLLHPTGIFYRFEKEDIEQSVSARFEKQVEKYPDRIAIKDRDTQITYVQLNRNANRLARSILAHRGDTAEPIVLLLEHGVPAITGIFGVLKAGKFYVPLDPLYPFARNTYMLSDSQAQLIVTDNKNLDIARKLTGNSLRIINIDGIDPSLSDQNLGFPISPDSLAYIIYTSGSTGQPKGVFNNHRNLLHIAMRHINEIHICPDDRLSFLRSYSFNGALKDIFGSLLGGASIYPFDVKKEGMAGLADWLIREEITIYCSVVTTFRQFASTLTGKEEFPKLRVIYTGGEMAARRDVELYKKYMSPECIFVCALGTAETATARQFFIDKQTQIESSTIPVGYPVEDMEILLLDENHKELGFDESGEIAVRSRYVALGYWRRPEHTKRAFLATPDDRKERIYLTGDMGIMLPDGCLIHKGRKDYQVKVRGHRIETSEVEMALLSMVNVKDVVVLVREDKHGYQRLVAYLVLTSEPAPTVSELRRALSEKLPDYMIPSAFVFMDSFPVAPSTKLDYAAFPDPPTSRPELENPFVAPRTPLEKTLAEIWSQILDLDKVGVNDNFFDLGGHSLLATQFISKVASEFRVEIPLVSFFQSPTLASMSLVIAQRKAENGDIERTLAELEAMSDAEARELLAGEESKK